ncbi:MAG: hypothetical protein WC750_03835 [Patescibacteria group bacterium]
MAKELSERHEGFAFHGLEDESYSSLKATDEEYPGLVTPIDILIQRLKAHGFKVAFGDHVNSGQVFILPLDSNNTEDDSVLARHLKITDDMDPGLKTLILRSKAVAKDKKW